MKLFDYEDYHRFLQDYLRNQPKEGFGFQIKIAQKLNINPSIVAQVLKGKKEFTIEQAYDFCDFADFDRLEKEYFLLLVEYARAGKANYKQYLYETLLQVKEKASDLKELIPPKKELGDEAKALFYSQWYYSGVRVLTSLEDYKSIEAIAARLNLPKKTVAEVVEFLVQHSLCIEEDGVLKPGAQSTHIGAHQNLVERHHANWRLKAIEKVGTQKNDQLFFTSPLSISKNDASQIRKLLTETIEQIFKVVDPSPSEEVFCLNIDWFHF